MVRIWCVPWSILDRRRLLGQHVEAHTLISVELARLSGRKCGYQNHPESIKYQGRLGELVDVHNGVAEEMTLRGYNHRTPVSYTATHFTPTPDEVARDIIEVQRRQEVEKKVEE
jgi:hypothetical protein